MRDHTSKAFQPKYKDFCIIGLLGKNQDNHGHTTKVHRIPMTEKVCQLYKEEQVGKVRNGKKAIPDSKMPDLGWDATEELEVQEVSQIEHSVPIFPETLIAIALVIAAFLGNINPLFALDIFICSFRKCIQHTTRGQSNFPLSKLCCCYIFIELKYWWQNSITAHIYANCDWGIVNR